MSWPRAFKPWHPQTYTRELVDASNAISVEYSDQLQLSVQLVFYTVVSRDRIGMTEREYNRLCEILNLAQQVRPVPIDLFRKNEFNQKDAEGWTSAEHIGYNVILLVQPMAPAKTTDIRSFNGLTMQYEALNAVILGDIVRHSIESGQNNDVRQPVIDSKASIHSELHARYELYTV